MNYLKKISAKAYLHEILAFISVTRLKENAKLYVFFRSLALCPDVTGFKSSFWQLSVQIL